MASKFRKGQRVICINYKDRPEAIVDSVDSKNDELWVRSTVTKRGQSDYWYGRLSWFKRVPSRRKRIARKVNKVMAEHNRNKKALQSSGLCDSLIPGCTCNQSSSVSQ